MKLHWKIFCAWLYANCLAYYFFGNFGVSLMNFAWLISLGLEILDKLT